MGKCTTERSSPKAEATNSPTAPGSATSTTVQLTESEKSNLYVIKREIGRGYAVTLKDLHFLVELLERCGL